MNVISEYYKDQLTEMHKDQPKFGAGSGKRKERVMSLGYTDILDYGCGKGYLDIENIKRYDPGIVEFADDPEESDLIVCTDVLEHIEPELIEDVLNHIHSKMKIAGYFTIALNPSVEMLPDGRDAHILLRPTQWWIAILNKYFDVISYRTIGHGGRRVPDIEGTKRELEVELKKHDR